MLPNDNDIGIFLFGRLCVTRFVISNSIKFRVFDKNNVLQDVLLFTIWHHLCMNSLLAKGIPRR